MDNKSYIRLINAHSECNGGTDDWDISFNEFVLNLLFFFCGK